MGRSLLNGKTDITPAWVDAGTIVFVRTVKSEPVVMVKQMAGGDERELARRARFPSATTDGRRIVFNQRIENQSVWQVAWVDRDRPTEIQRLGPAHAGGRFPSVSPDGTLVAYISGEVGRDEVFLTRLPSGEGKFQISTQGGGWARFSPRGDELFYRAPDGAFMSVAISAQRELRIGQPKKLFEWGAGWLLFYDVARDAQRGVAPVPISKAAHVPRVSIVQNWQVEFAGR